LTITVWARAAIVATTKGIAMSMQTELNTITSTMTDLSARITSLVESEGDAMAPDVYAELVAAERTVGALLRRLSRVAARAI
jgi:outer membrane murein-binding lipoprotein Lpp